MGALTFRALFREHSNFVWRVLRRHGVPTREIDDACQEVFIVVFRRLSSFENRGSMRSWIYGIAVRVALSVRRRAFFRREFLQHTAPEMVSTSLDGFDAYAREQTLQQLWAAIALLPRAKREVFVLYELEGLTMAETATAMGVPENTALYRLYAARKQLTAAFACAQPTREALAWPATKKGATS